ncbi:unnamed protein product [Phytophthora lilii]|uniref:histone deacetylase n=1 Tax=Phytophthora lilii TaxID=2077276 RepID=A0A9W7DC97_9STRA|nr:unnamed protein product [Phytophthora lilii]
MLPFHVRGTVVFLAVAGPHAQSNGCAVCGSDQNGDSILLCDGCDGEYHTYCLVPPLTEIPAGDFYCKKCTDANLAKQRKAAAEGAAAAGAAPAAAAPSKPTAPAPTTHASGAAPPVALAAAPAKPTILMKESKYRGVSKVSMKGVKKPFVAKLWQGSKYLQLGTFGSEIEAAHAYDKAALMHYGKSAQLNFPHLHDSFLRPEVAFSVRPQHPTIAPSVAITASATPPPARPASAEMYTSPGRGRGRGRGRGGRGGRGRTKRSQDSPDAHGTNAQLDTKRRKVENAGQSTGSTKQKASSIPAKKYLGVQVHRVYAHAQIHVNGKVVNLGTFATAKDAAMAYDKAALKYFGGPVGSSESRPDEIVLNFPEKRDELLKQLIEEEKQKMTRQTAGSSYASRSAQNAKYNLSIMKLHSWMSKLQRSVKMVEASQRVQWGLHPSPVKSEDEQGESQQDDETSVSSLVKTEIFGSGPTIKKEFTTRDQKLRQSKKEIQDAISLMIEELKIYAADAPVDPLFQPPPRCAPILDLLSTSRHLKLICAINDLAHLKVKVDATDPNSVVDGRFESKLQAVVDYRARLQMSSINEKQKLAHFMRDMESGVATDPNNASSTATAASNTLSTTEPKPLAVKPSDLLKNAKYVKRKVLISKPTEPAPTDAPSASLPKEKSTEHNHPDEEMKEEPPSLSSEAENVSVDNVKMEVIVAEKHNSPEHAPVKASADVASTESGYKESTSAVSVEKGLNSSEISGSNEESTGGDVVAPPSPKHETKSGKESADMETENMTGSSESMDSTTTPGEDKTEAKKADTSEEEKTDLEKSKDGKAEEDRPEDKTEEEGSEECAELEKPHDNNKLDTDTSKDDNPQEVPFPETKMTANAKEPNITKSNDDIVIENTRETASPTALVAPKDDYEWQFCLAIQVPSVNCSPTTAEDLWRLLPLSSKTQVGEFVENIFLTEKEVSEMEVSEKDVCLSTAATKGKTAWMEHLRQLHVEENQVRQQIQRETNHQHALHGIMKIEQDRLNEISVVYREAMNKLDTKTSLALKNHARVNQDAQLVKLMQHSFNPILGDLLDKCEEALLSCFKKLSLRFEDFSQEFEYYRNALLSLMQSPGNEAIKGGGNASPADPADLVVDNSSVTIKRENIAKVTGDSADTIASTPDEVLELGDDCDPILEEGDESDDLGGSSGLRDAYISFYMSEMEALWKERSSSLEMVQAIQRSLLSNVTEVKTSTDKSIAKKMSLRKETSADAEMKVEEEEGVNMTVTKSAEINTPSEQHVPNPGLASVESSDTTVVTEKGTHKTVDGSSDAQENAGTSPDINSAQTELPKHSSAQVGSEIVVKTETEELSGKFRREQELREAVELCLAQWQRIQWPEELNSTFLTPTTLGSTDPPQVFKSEGANSQSPTATNEGDTKFESPYSVMDELKRVMIDLTQDQVISASPAVEPKTLVMYHPVFINHQTPKNHPECPERMDRVVNILNTLVKKHQETLKLDRLSMSPEELCSPETTLLMVHSPTYLRQLKERSIEAGSQSASSPTASSPSSRALVFESDSGILEETPKRGGRKKNGRPPLVGAFGAASLEQNGVELDTFVSSKSWDVARAAAGTVCLAVDRVVRKEYHNAVCLVRPPGHHVGRHGRTENAPSSGFCLLNNVVIGATHARLYPWIHKVAVLDWDIHHGNGTEELLKDDPDAFFASIHLYSSGKYFPGTGKSCETGNLINVALKNTGAGSGSSAFRSALEKKVLPAMRAFQPDIIFISAGFDGHRDDILGGVAAVNNPNVPAGYVEEDYAWATLEVLKLAAEVCDGRVVSVLEGGYDVRRETNSLAKSVAAHVAAISAYEAAQRKAGGNATADVEMKGEEGPDKTAAATGAATSAHGAIVKMEHAIKKEPSGLLEKLLATDLSDGSVIIIDDEDNEEEGGHEVHVGDDVEDEDTGEEDDDGDVAMHDAEGEPESEEPHDHDEKGGQESVHSAMEVDDS